MTVRTRALLGAPALLLALASCGSASDGVSAAAPTVTTTVTVAAPGGTGDAPKAAPPVTQTVTVTETVTAEPESEPDAEGEGDAEPDADGEAAPPAEATAEDQIGFGQTWTWDDGISITVSEPEPYTISSTGIGGEAFESAVLVDVTVENASGTALDLFLVSASVQSGRSAGDQIFDSANNLSGSPGSTLLDGRSVEFPLAFGVEDPEDIVLQIAPTWDHEDAFFVTGG